MRLEHSLVVLRPRAEVFAFLSDPDKLALWQSGIVEVETNGDPIGLGYRHREVRTLLGRRIDQTLEVTAYEPPGRLDLKVVEGPIPVTISHTLTDVDGGTDIHVVGEADPGPLFRFGARLVTGKVRDQSKRDFGRLKELLEAV